MPSQLLEGHFQLSMRIISSLALALVMVCFCTIDGVTFDADIKINMIYGIVIAVSTHDQNVFSFYPDNRPCNGFEEALSRYREIVPSVRLAGLFISTR